MFVGQLVIIEKLLGDKLLRNCSRRSCLIQWISLTIVQKHMTWLCKWQSWAAECVMHNQAKRWELFPL